jgi:Xaa-Pro aminopeptidase
VAFDPPAWLSARHRAACRVEATALAATRAVGREGGTAGDVFEAVREAYDVVGWSGEWRNHHQGGAAGFAGREWIATPGATASVRLPMAYAWNPTVAGAKSEGTVLVTASGYERLTAGEWPTVTAEAVGRDERLERPGLLRR